MTTEVPSPDDAVGRWAVRWGHLEEIGTPAYWASQAWAWSLEEPEHFKLGRCLEEEVLACLLGGHGIKAEVGLAAYERLRAIRDTEPGTLTDAARLERILSMPLTLAGRSVRYRFARQKASYVASAFRALPGVDADAPDLDLRDQLTTIRGIGLKTASWIVRNWRASEQVAILDIHIVRACRELGVFPEGWTVERRYRDLEGRFLEFAEAIGARPSILDSVIWMTVRSLTPGVAHKNLEMRL